MDNGLPPDDLDIMGRQVDGVSLTSVSLNDDNEKAMRGISFAADELGKSVSSSIKGAVIFSENYQVKRKFIESASMVLEETIGENTVLFV